MSREYPDYPIPGVGGIIFLDGKAVLVKRGNEPGYGTWSIPGGAVKRGESLEEAVKREVYEETGLIVDVLEVVKVLDPIVRDEMGRVLYHYVLVDFLCMYKSGELRADSDVLDARAVSISELINYNIPKVTLEVIEKGFELLR